MNEEEATLNSNKKILIVEDSKLQSAALADMLLQEGYAVKIARDGLEGLYILTEFRPHLIVSDVWMPKMDGYYFCRTLKDDKALNNIPVILLTRLSNFTDIVKGLNAGADYYLTKPYSKDLLISMVKSIFSEMGHGNGGDKSDIFDVSTLDVSTSSRRVFNFLCSTHENLLSQNKSLMQTRQELGKLNRYLEKRVKEKTDSIRKVLNGTVIALSKMVELRDPYTAGHQLRVAQLAQAIGREVGLSEEQCEGIRIMGILHDVGKIIVPAEILCKPTMLTEYEYHFIKAHTQAGCNILKDIEFPWPVAAAVVQHHERLNGSGYPSGLSCDEIIVEAKILAVADVVESMASHRPYRPSLGIEQALGEICRHAGVLYAPEIVDASMKLFNEKGFIFK